MPGNALKIVLWAVTTATIAGCGLGEEGTIPQDDADALLSRLDAVETNVNSGACDLARQQAGEFSDAVDALPAEVDGEVKDGLRQAADRLVELTADDSECIDAGATGVTGAVPPPEEVETIPEEETTTTETETTTDEETPSEEAPPEEEEEEEPPAEEEQPPEPPGGGGEGGAGSDGGTGPTGGVGGGGGE